MLVCCLIQDSGCDGCQAINLAPPITKEAAQTAVLRTVPLGAATLAGIAGALVVLLYLAI